MARDTFDLNSPGYKPVRLINETAAMLRAKSDYQLGLILEVDHGQLSRIRHRKGPITDRLIVAIADRTGWSVQYIRELGGIEFDGAARLVMLAQRIGRRFPHLYKGTTDEPD